MNKVFKLVLAVAILALAIGMLFGAGYLGQQLRIRPEPIVKGNLTNRAIFLQSKGFTWQVINTEKLLPKCSKSKNIVRVNLFVLQSQYSNIDMWEIQKERKKKPHEQTPCSTTASR